MIRRDYGPEALEAFISEAECARSDMSETEQARQEKQMEDRIRKALERISDPRQKIELMVKHSLGQGLYEYIVELVQDRDAHYMCNHPPISRAVVDSEVHDSEDKFAYLYLLISVFGTTQPGANRRHEDDLVINVRALLNLMPEPDDFTDLATDLLVIMSEMSPKSNLLKRDGLAGMELAAEFFLNQVDEEDQQLRGNIEILALRSIFDTNEAHSCLHERLFPDDPPMSKRPHLEVNEAYVARLQELGFDPVPELIEWLEERALSRHSMNWSGVFNLRCLTGNPVVVEIVTDKLLPEIWRMVKRGGVPWQWQVFQAVLGRIRWSVPGYLENFFRQELVEILSHGRAAFVFQFMWLFGSLVGLVTKHSTLSTHKTDDAEKVIASLSPAAFRKACDEERWGVAAALAHQFGVVDEDQCQTLVYKFFEDRCQEVFDGRLLSCQCRRCVSQGQDEHKLEELVFDEYVDFLRGEQLNDDEHCQLFPELAEQEERITSLWAEREAKFQELLKEERGAGAQSLEMALVLEQPIRLEFTDYIQLEE